MNQVQLQPIVILPYHNIIKVLVVVPAAKTPLEFIKMHFPMAAALHSQRPHNARRRTFGRSQQRTSGSEPRGSFALAGRESGRGLDM